MKYVRGQLYAHVVRFDFFSFVFIHIVIIKFGGGQGWENKVQYIRGQLYAHVDLIKQLVPTVRLEGGS